MKSHEQRPERRIASIVALAFGMLLLLVQGAFAQGAFYVEEEKEGRIYVFNSMKQYELWKKSGEMGVAITRPGEGPNGETVIFDSDEAIHMFNFHHGRPGEVLIRPEEKKPAMKFGWKDGKTSFETDNAQLNISNRIQIRFTQEDPEVGDSRGSFRIRRGKTKFDGWFYSRNLTYELQLNWPDTANPLEDANLNYAHTKAFQIKVGQFKVPYGRQELTSSGSQQFVDRSIVSNEFAKGRDAGVQLWGLLMNDRLDWRAGIFNGNGRTRSANDNDEFQYNARVTFQPFGDLKYSESDFESKDRPLFAIAGQFEQNHLHGATTGNDVDRRIFGGDIAFKYRGFSAFAEYHTRDNDPEAGLDSTSNGLAAQIGYFIVPAKFELAGRYAIIDPTDRTSGNDLTETGIAFNWFINKHNLKLQGDLRQIENDANNQTNKEGRIQLQFIF
ncbi:MAG TPA: porin [Thermoanaerobaculia bacterium]|nr:porin [Thermoanaerobaculia bacterium]